MSEAFIASTSPSVSFHRNAAGRYCRAVQRLFLVMIVTIAIAVPVAIVRYSSVSQSTHVVISGAESRLSKADHVVSRQPQKLLDNLPMQGRDDLQGATSSQNRSASAAAKLVATTQVAQLNSDIRQLQNELQRLNRALMENKEKFLALSALVKALYRPWLGHSGELLCAVAQRCANYINAGESSLAAIATVASCKARTPRGCFMHCTALTRGPSPPVVEIPLCERPCLPRPSCHNGIPARSRSM